MSDSPERPAWLPELFDVQGDREEVIARLFAQFEADFNEGLYFRHRPVRVSNAATDKYPDRFLHIIERERSDADWRDFEPQRAQRLPWCAAIIRNTNDPQVRVWDYIEGSGQQRVYLWLQAHDFIVILEHQPRKKKGVYWLITAFVVDSKRTRDELQGKWERRYLPTTAS